MQLQIVDIFTQLTSLSNAIIDFTNSEWPSSSSSHNEYLQFGIAMDIIFPEVKCPLLYQRLYTKETMTFTSYYCYTGSCPLIHGSRRTQLCGSFWLLLQLNVIFKNLVISPGFTHTSVYVCTQCVWRLIWVNYF